MWVIYLYKATTTDGMGPEGRNEGVSAYATVLLEKLNEDFINQ